MTHQQKFFLVKQAMSLNPNGVFLAANALNSVPWSTYTRGIEGQRARGIGAGLTTDIGRMAGGLGGAMAIPRMVGQRVTNPKLRLAIVLGSMGLGGSAGHLLGRAGGEAMFEPTAPRQRIANALQVLRGS